MLLDEKIQTLQNLTKRKITYDEIAPILGLGSKQAVQNRITRKQKLKEWEILALDERFLKNINLTAEPINDTITIDYVNINPSCGYGTSVYDTAEITPVKLGLDVIRSVLKISNPNVLRMFRASGDSMEPIIEDGDLLLVDTTRTDYHNGGVFLLTINNDWYIKRLRKRMNGQLEIISDNTKYETETFNPDDTIEVYIKGRVVKNLSRGL